MKTEFTAVKRYASIPSDTFFTSYTSAIAHALADLEVTDRHHTALNCEDAVSELCARTRDLARTGRRQFICGNGASAAIANHMSLDWTKNGGVPTLSFSDSAFLPAVGNDLGHEEVFASPLRWYGAAGDQLIAISSSGNSPNIVHAIRTARELGLGVITFTGLRPDNTARLLGDLNFYVPAKTYGIVECVHQVLLHLCLDRYMGIKEWEKTKEQNMLKAAFSL
jgi:Phosphoheptose isomerase